MVVVRLGRDHLRPTFDGCYRSSFNHSAFQSANATFARDDLLPGLVDLPLVDLRRARRRLGARDQTFS